jgi:hypothetical protein
MQTNCEMLPNVCTKIVSGIVHSYDDIRAVSTTLVAEARSPCSLRCTEEVEVGVWG